MRTEDKNHGFGNPLIGICGAFVIFVFIILLLMGGNAAGEETTAAQEEFSPMDNPCTAKEVFSFERDRFSQLALESKDPQEIEEALRGAFTQHILTLMAEEHPAAGDSC